MPGLHADPQANQPFLMNYTQPSYNRKHEVAPINPKELYYYTGSHQYAPQEEMFKTPQMVPPYTQEQPVKFTSKRPNERSLLQYCSPMIRPTPIQRNRPALVFKIVKLSGFIDQVKSQSILNLCKQFGTVEAIKIVKKDNKLDCFVNFAQDVQAQAVVEHLDGLTLGNDTVETSLTKYNNMNEIDLFEKGKVVSKAVMQTLFMDTTSDDSQINANDTPIFKKGIQATAIVPSQSLEVLGVKQDHRSELEALFGEGLVSLRWIGGYFLAKFATTDVAFNIIANHHQTSLHDGR